jgi:hypothetical protein
VWDLVLLSKGKGIQENRDVRLCAADDNAHKRPQISWQSTDMSEKIFNFTDLKDSFQQTSQAFQTLLQSLHEHSNLSIYKSSEEDQNTYKVHQNPQNSVSPIRYCTRSMEGWMDGQIELGGFLYS